MYLQSIVTKSNERKWGCYILQVLATKPVYVQATYITSLVSCTLRVNIYTMRLIL